MLTQRPAHPAKPSTGGGGVINAQPVARQSGPRSQGEHCHIPAASAKESNAKMAAFFNSQSSTPLMPGRRVGERIKSEARQTG
jgi:hypothetical protein